MAAAPLLAGIAAGTVAGVLARDVPLWVALQLAASRSAGAECGDLSILECAIDNVDDLAVGLFRLFVALVVLELAGVVAAAVLLAVGARRRQPWLLAAGTAVLVPVAWQAASLAWYLLS